MLIKYNAMRGKKISILLFIFVGIALNCEIFAQRTAYVLNPSQPKSQKEAILILPGFGSKVFGTKKIRKYFKFQGYDLYVPKYISRKSVDKSVDKLDLYIQDHGLLEYQKLHVFAYIFGSWTINEWINKKGRNNIQTVVYDRSPLQERVPAALVQESPVLSRVLFGKVMFDFCKTPYRPLTDTTIFKGICIETFATKLINKHKKVAVDTKRINWSADSLNQTYNDYWYLPLNHDEMYWDLTIFGAEVLHFIKFHTFSEKAKSNRISEDPFIKFIKK